MSEEYYLERMTEAEDQAKAAKLPNVQERCRRSAAVWRDMAARAAETALRKRDKAKPAEVR